MTIVPGKGTKPNYDSVFKFLAVVKGKEHFDDLFRMSLSLSVRKKADYAYS